MKKKVFMCRLVTGLGALVSVIVNLLLIPMLGIMGAALAALASYIVMALGLYIVTQKFYKIEYESVKMMSIFAIILIISRNILLA
ncbi:MAG: polysaccharide biosynthesis C-terminal domain-containing protein [Ignavibacteriales bacterium]|nr:polysaccharide biosynthesis C-terminal domain-containing protein [Ignavibacteriales bacterium]